MRRFKGNVMRISMRNSMRNPLDNTKVRVFGRCFKGSSRGPDHVNGVLRGTLRRPGAVFGSGGEFCLVKDLRNLLVKK